MKLSLTHSAASWGCLSGFLEQGCTSSDPWLRKLCFCLETWVEMYDVFLARSQNNKSKPMKRMLLTLSKLLIQNPDKSARESLKEHVISTTTRLICDNGDFHSVKPAFLFLDHLLAKRIVPASSVIIKLSKGFVMQGKFCQYGSDFEEVKASNDLSLSRSEWIHMIETFVSCVLKWVQYPDISLVGGRLLASFFKSLQICDRESSLIRSLGKDPSLWVKPIMKALDFEPSLLEILESHVLPGLLRLDFDGEKPFLDKALRKDLKNENVKKYSVPEIQLYLLAIKIDIENYHARKASMSK